MTIRAPGRVEGLKRARRLRERVRLRGVIFDVDGVLVRSMEKHAEAYEIAFRRIGVDVTRDEVYRNEGRGSRDVTAAIAQARGLDLTPTELDELAREKQRTFTAFGPMPKYEGVDALIDGLTARGLKLGMVTGTTRANVQNHFGSWLDRFDVVVTANDVARTKPDPEPYQKAVDALGLPKEEIVVVENAPLGIQSAKAAGLRTIAITTTNPPEALKAADAIVASIQDVEALL